MASANTNPSLPLIRVLQKISYGIAAGLLFFWWQSNSGHNDFLSWPILAVPFILIAGRVPLAFVAYQYFRRQPEYDHSRALSNALLSLIAPYWENRIFNEVAETGQSSVPPRQS